MTLEQITSIREDIDKLNVTAKNEDGTEVIIKTPIHLYCDTNISQWTDWRDGSMIWDDDRELIITFSYNSNHTIPLTPAISPGNRPVAPCYVGYIQYDSIISMKAVLIEETFWKLLDQLNITDEATRQTIYHRYFVETDQSYIIPRKNKIGYSSQHSKEFMKDKYYDDMAQYKKTIHPQCL